MSRRRRGGLGGGTIGLENMAGWLFADLLLVMFLVGVGAEITQASLDEPKAKPPIVEVKPPSMDPTPERESIRVDARALLDSGAASARAEKKRIRKEIRDVARDLQGQRAAMVLLWGHSPDVGRGQALSEAVADQLPKAMPKTFRKTVDKTLWKGDPREGEVEMEMYIYSE